MKKAAVFTFLCLTLAMPARASLEAAVNRCLTQGTPTGAEAPMTGPELESLLEKGFEMTEGDQTIAILVDISTPDSPRDALWLARQQVALQWAQDMRKQFPGKKVILAAYAGTGVHNGNLPESAHLLENKLPENSEELAAIPSRSLRDILAEADIVLAVTKFSATAPLTKLTEGNKFRGATLPSFRPEMTRALRLDFAEVDRRCKAVDQRLAGAQGAKINFVVGGKMHEMYVDLRHRKAIVGSGIIPAVGPHKKIGNLPGGETFIVPYEGEKPGDPSRTSGIMPVQYGDEIILYRLENNQVVEILSQGPFSDKERARIHTEKAAYNLAELGFGILQSMNVAPLVGPEDSNILLNEKIGFHMAFGRSDHIGGVTGVANFSSPAQVTHIDRVYIPEMQPGILLSSVAIHGADGEYRPLIANGSYVPGVFDLAP